MHERIGRDVSLILNEFTVTPLRFCEIIVCLLFQHDVQRNFFDSNCAEIGVKFVEMDGEDCKLQSKIIGVN